MSSYKVRKLFRCTKAKHAWVIEVAAHQIFAVIDDLRNKLGEIQHVKISPEEEKVNPRPWYFVFVKDSVSAGYRSHDGELDMRLYVNDDAVATHFYLLTGKTDYATIEL